MEHMKLLHEAKRKAWDQLDELLRRNDPPEKMIDHMYKLIKIIKNGGEAEMLEEYADGESFDGEIGSSYARGGRRHYVRAHYSHDRGDDDGRGMPYDGHSYRRGRSRSGGEEDFRRLMHDAMDCAEDDRQRDVIRQCIEKLDRM